MLVHQTSNEGDFSFEIIFIHLFAAFGSSTIWGWTLALGSGEFQGLAKVKRCPASSLSLQGDG